MYGYRKSLENGLMTNLNSISSSLSSIDTIGRRNNTLGKSSVDNLINPSRTRPMVSTSALYRGFKDDRYPTMPSARTNSSRYQASDVYYNGKRRNKTGSCCPNSRTALNFTLIPLLLLTILRQVFDFLGQIWLQILINFFTILIIIVALFGVRQGRLSYLIVFIFWAVFNTLWNLLVISIHSKMRDVTLTEDFLSLYTGAISWWHSNGPGCLPYTITSPIQHQSVSILKPNIITGCRIDYHLLESTQAALHASLSLISVPISCFIAWSVRGGTKGSSTNGKQSNAADKTFRMNDLTNGRSSSKINHDPCPDSIPSTATSRFVSNGSASMRRSAINRRTGSRSSQHSLVSARSERRRQRQASEAAGSGVLPTPRGSTSSTQRSQKYGSLSSRRSKSNRQRMTAGDVNSMTYASTSAKPRPGTSTAVTANGQRPRLSSLSSADYLPSYQPPHSSSANLLSSYGEISSIDSYGNRTASKRGHHKMTDRNNKLGSGGNTNPTYNGSRSSVCSRNMNNYDDISALYAGSAANASNYATSAASNDRTRHFLGDDDALRGRNHTSRPRDIRAEIYKMNTQSFHPNGHAQQASSSDGFAANGGTFQSFSASSLKSRDLSEVNNNHMPSNYLDNTDNRKNGTYATNLGPPDDLSRSTTAQPGYMS